MIPKVLVMLCSGVFLGSHSNKRSNFVRWRLCLHSIDEMIISDFEYKYLAQRFLFKMAYCTRATMAPTSKLSSINMAAYGSASGRHILFPDCVR